MDLFKKENLPGTLIAGFTLGLVAYNLLRSQEKSKPEPKEEKKESRPPSIKRSSVLITERKLAYDFELIKVPHLSDWIDDEERSYNSPLIFESCSIGPSVESTPGFVI